MKLMVAAFGTLRKPHVHDSGSMPDTSTCTHILEECNALLAHCVVYTRGGLRGTKIMRVNH